VPRLLPATEHTAWRTRPRSPSAARSWDNGRGGAFITRALAHARDGRGDSRRGRASRPDAARVHAPPWPRPQPPWHARGESQASLLPAGGGGLPRRCSSFALTRDRPRTRVQTGMLSNVYGMQDCVARSGWPRPRAGGKFQNQSSKNTGTFMLCLVQSPALGSRSPDAWDQIPRWAGGWVAPATLEFWIPQREEPGKTGHPVLYRVPHGSQFTSARWAD